MTNKENSKKFLEIFKEPNNDLDDEGDFETIKKKQYGEGKKFKRGKSPPYTKEFHSLTEVQKTRILKIIEDVIKKLADDDCAHSKLYLDDNNDKLLPGLPHQCTSNKKSSCRKFSISWIIIKIFEMVT